MATLGNSNGRIWIDPFMDAPDLRLSTRFIGSYTTGFTVFQALMSEWVYGIVKHQDNGSIWMETEVMIPVRASDDAYGGRWTRTRIDTYLGLNQKIYWTTGHEDFNRTTIYDGDIVWKPRTNELGVVINRNDKWLLADIDDPTNVDDSAIFREDIGWIVLGDVKNGFYNKSTLLLDKPIEFNKELWKEY